MGVHVLGNVFMPSYDYFCTLVRLFISPPFLLYDSYSLIILIIIIISSSINIINGQDGIGN